MSRTRTTGTRWERKAESFLRAHGLKPVTRNFSCRLGEIDLVMHDGQCLIVVEVRYRAGRRLAPAHLTVDRRKQQKLVRAAAMFLARHPGYAVSPLRFDVIAIEVDDRGRKTVNWIRDAFRLSDSSL